MEKLIADVEIMFHHAGGEFNASRKELTVQEAFDFCKQIAESYPGVEPLQKWWSTQNTIEKFGYYGSSKGGKDAYNFHTDIRARLEKGTEIHVCPRVNEATMAVQIDHGNKATWDKVGEDRVCSYCGSLHPEDFEKILDLCIESNGQKANVGLTDKGYKIYAQRSEVVNAGQGGIKFYTQHVFALEEPLKSEYIKRTEPKIVQAVKVSKY